MVTVSATLELDVDSPAQAVQRFAEALASDPNVIYTVKFADETAQELRADGTVVAPTSPEQVNPEAV